MASRASTSPALPGHRAFVSPLGKSVQLSLAGEAWIERRASKEKRRVAAEPLRAFVGLANRARALVRDGLVEDAPHAEARPVELTGWEGLAAYASAIDPSRSLPRQELLIASSITPAMVRRDPRLGEALATLCLLEWPSTFDVAAVIAELDEPEAPLFAVLTRELRADKKTYPKELVRLASAHGSERTLALALAALPRTRDPDAWFDVLIEGEPFLVEAHLGALEGLTKIAPGRDVANMVREITRDLRKPRRRRR